MPVQQEAVREPLQTCTGKGQDITQTKKRIVHLTSVHYPFDVRIFHKECKTLAKYGYEVILIAPHLQSAEIEGVQLQHVKVPANRACRMTITAWEVFRKALKLHADIYHFHDPELLSAGLLLKLMGKRVIYDVHENVKDDILTKTWIAKPLRPVISRFIGSVERLFSIAFDAVIAATPPIATRFSVKKTKIIQNFPIPDELIAADGMKYQERPLIALYIGSITAIRGAVEMVNAVKLLANQLSIKLVFLGNIYPETLKIDLLSNVTGNQVEFLGFQNRNKVSTILGKSRVGLVLFHPVPNYVDSQPNKLFEYMAAGIPVIASDFPGWRELLVDKIDCGIVVNPLNVGEIAKAIEWIVKNPQEAEAMGRRGQEAVHSFYNWKTQESELLELYRKIIQ